MAAATEQKAPLEDWEVLSDTIDSVAAEEANGECSNSIAESNPIGELQEFCTKALRAVPEYKEIYKSGLPHLCTYVYTCTVKQHVATGSGRSKKLAKKAAASSLLKLLDEKATTYSSERVEAPPEIQEIENTLNQLAADGERSKDVSSADIEYQLKNLAKKFNVPIEFHPGSDIEGRSVWICQFEDTTISGYGDTPQAARIDAGKALVHHLRLKYFS